MASPLLETYGEAAVYAAGMAALGYPPTLVHTTRELLKVVPILKGSKAHESGIL